MHDRHLGISSGVDQSIAIPFHWSRGASLLNSKLTNGVAPSERDALWICAGMLGALSFASILAESPEEAWPLKQQTATPAGDLAWLKMSEGKKEIWKITNPMRPNSIFRPLAAYFTQYFEPVSYEPSLLHNLPQDLLSLCHFSSTTTEASISSPEFNTNPYFSSVFTLAHLLPMPCNRTTFSRFMTFFGSMHTSFKSLLEQKDTAALILLAYWYAKMCDLDQWWLKQRVVLECRATCMYLQQHYTGGDEDHGKILRLLEFPKARCGMDRCWMVL